MILSQSHGRELQLDIKKLSITLLLLFVFLFQFPTSIIPTVYASNVLQGTLLGANIYLKSTQSSPPYYDVSLIKPTGSTINNITIDSNGIQSSLIGSWKPSITFATNKTFEYDYNFLFCIYSSATDHLNASAASAKLYAEFSILRSSSEIFLFRTSSSEYIPTNLTALLWQYKTTQSLSFITGDSLIIKFYFDIFNEGIYTFYYDFYGTPSNFVDPVETRYMRSDTDTVNGLFANKLSTTQSSSAGSTTTNVAAVALSSTLRPTTDHSLGITTAAPPGTHYTTLDESPASDADYVKCGDGDAITQDDDYNKTGYSLPGGSKIACVIVYFRGKTEVSGVIKSTYCAKLVISGSSYYTTQYTTTSYTTQSYIYVKNPATSAEWTASAINNMYVGCQVACGLKLPATYIHSYISQLYIEIYTYTDATVYYSIDVIVRSSAPLDTTVNTKVAGWSALQSTTYTTFGLVSNLTYVCPQTAIGDLYSIIVSVYVKIGAGGWTLCKNFTTEQISYGEYLGASTWGVYYYIDVTSTSAFTQSVFYYGTSTYNSRVTNFNYTISSPPTIGETYVNSTINGTVCQFSSNVSTTSGTLSKYIFSTNNTGSWVNSSATSFVGAVTSQFARYNATLNSTVAHEIAFIFYANNSANLWVASSTYNLITDSGAWGLTSYNNRRMITINNVTGAGTNYQVMLTIINASGTDSGSTVYIHNVITKTDFSDIRFTDDNGTTQLNYWNQTTNSQTNITYWVNVADNLTRSIRGIFLYYNYTSATYGANGERTFLFFDEFNSTSLNATKWTNSSAPTYLSGGICTINTTGAAWVGLYGADTYSYPIRYKSYSQLPDYSNYELIGLDDDSYTQPATSNASARYVTRTGAGGGKTRTTTINGSDYTDYDNTGMGSGYMRYEILSGYTFTNFMINETQIYNITTTSPIAPMRPVAFVYVGVTTAVVNMDWVFVTKMVTTALTNLNIYFGSQEIISIIPVAYIQLINETIVSLDRIYKFTTITLYDIINIYDQRFLIIVIVLNDPNYIYDDRYIITNITRYDDSIYIYDGNYTAGGITVSTSFKYNFPIFLLPIGLIAIIAIIIYDEKRKKEKL